MKEDYPVFTKWMLILELIMDRAEGIPKSVRYTLTSRILNYANDILELIIEAIYSKDKSGKIDTINLILEKLRVYFRICEKRNYIAHKQYYRISAEIDEFGKMIGGWKKNVSEQKQDYRD
jgi:hypothetical protein